MKRLVPSQAPFVCFTIQAGRQVFPSNAVFFCIRGGILGIEIIINNYMKERLKKRETVASFRFTLKKESCTGTKIVKGTDLIFYFQL